MIKHKMIIAISILSIFTIVLGLFFYGCILLDSINFKELPDSDEELGITPAPLPSKESGVAEAVSTPDTPDVSQSPNAPETPHTPDTTNTPDIADAAETATITNIVLFGLDRRNPDEASRSDTIIVVSLDGKNKVIKISSLMRDMYVPIPGKGSNRINAAYSYGGALLAIKTINSNLGLDIRDYVAVDFIGLANMIDKVGGLDIHVKEYEIPEIEGVTEPGLQSLNGRQIVDYARIRYVGDADFERTQRQRYVLDLLYKKIKSQGIIKLPETVSALLPYVETSLSKTEIMKLVLKAAQFQTEELKQLRLPADGYFVDRKIRGMYVLVPDLEENKKILHNFIYEAED